VFTKLLRHVAETFRLRGPLAEDPTARMFNVLLCALTAWWGTWTAVLLRFHWSDLFWSMQNEIATLAALVTALTFLRRGWFRAAGISYLAGIWFFATHIMAFNGGIRSSAQVLYITLPISAAWLLGYAAAFWISGACMFCTLVFAVLEMLGVNVPRKIPGTPLGAWAVFGMACLIGAVPVAQILRDLRFALTKSQRAEEESQRTMLRLQTEIEGHKRTEQALSESEKRFRITADTAPVMILVQDANQNATFFNKVWLDFAGRSLEQELGNGWTEGVHPDDLRGCVTDLSAAYSEHKEYRLQFRLRRKDREFRWITCHGVPRFKAGSTFDGFIASAIDISDLKRSQEELMARQKWESLGVLAAGIAHDFNNLLGAILAEGELAEADLPSDSSPTKEIQRIKETAIRGAEIVRELMIYSGREEAVLEPVDVSRIVEEMLQLLKISISKHSILKANLSKNLPAVLGNAPQIRQVVMNLVINASEAIGEREGVINVTTAHVSVDQDLALNIETDVPITEEAKGKIFDPFYTTKFAGRGLGLAVVQGIVRAQGGVINLASKPGQGTTFQVLLCCARQSSDAEKAVISPQAEKFNAGTGTILVVEDEELIRRAVSMALKKNGFTVVMASDGSAAMDLLGTQKNDIDLILLDVTLPGRSSREIFEEAQRVRPDLKVILTSAYGKETIDTAFAGLRVEHFIRKPFQLRDLMNLLQATLPTGGRFPRG